MKTICVVVVCLTMIAIAPAMAQFKQGVVMIGGNASFEATADKVKSGNTTTTQDNNVNLSITPQAGYFVIDNLALGAGISLISQSRKYKGNSTEKDTYSFIGFSPFARYYYNKVFAQLQYTIGPGKEKVTGVDGDYTQKSTISGLSIGVGYAILLNNSVAIEPLLAYSSTGVKYKGQDEKNITSGLSLSVGIQVYLNR